MPTMTLTGWHFAGNTLRDGRPLPKKGETLTHEGECVPCEIGLHFSQRALDALDYAPGAMVARVEGPADALPHGSPEDKRCGAWRRNLTDYVDATRTLHEFACWCATRALDREEARGNKADPRSRKAVEVKLAWLDGKATDGELDAAKAAARDAARAAAWAAARDAERDAARDEQNTELERRLLALVEV